jgi:pyruvate dehydrogenase (quinone)
MVKLEQEQGGLPEFGTQLGDVNLAAIARAAGLHAVRVESADDLDEGVRATLAHPGPALLDVVTNPEEISLPPKVKAGQAWGFAIAKLTETLESRGA